MDLAVACIGSAMIGCGVSTIMGEGAAYLMVALQIRTTTIGVKLKQTTDRFENKFCIH